MKHRVNNAGFTIVELMFATVIFSVILLLCLNAMVQVGRMYYKGVASTRTQEAARNVMDEITRAIQFSGGDILRTLPPSGIPPYQVACAGDLRFSFVIDRQLKAAGSNEAQKLSRHVFWTDNLPNCANRSPIGPANLSQDSPQSTSPVANGTGGRELLSENMRLMELSIEYLADPGVWEVKVGVVYGDNDLLEVDPNDGRTKCRTQGSGNEYCAFSYLTSTVQRRLR